MRFLDSNVLLYLVDAAAPKEKVAIAEDLTRDAIESGDTISFQVVQESLNVLSRWQSAFTPADIARFYDSVLRPLWKVQPSEALYRRALGVHARYQYSFYDSLIISAALESNCERLLSEDFQHGQVIEGLTVVNPFL